MTNTNRVAIKETDKGYLIHGGGRGMHAMKIYCRHFSTAIAIKALMKNEAIGRLTRWDMIDALLIDEPTARPIAVPVSRLHLVVSNYHGQ